MEQIGKFSTQQLDHYKLFFYICILTHYFNRYWEVALFEKYSDFKIVDTLG